VDSFQTLNLPCASSPTWTGLVVVGDEAVELGLSEAVELGL
jgi:hypothetical protein